MNTAIKLSTIAALLDMDLDNDLVLELIKTILGYQEKSNESSTFEGLTI